MKVEKEYTPEVLNFVLPEGTELPSTIFEGEKPENLHQLVNSTFVAFSEPLNATRYMDDKEITDTKNELAAIVMDDLPDHKDYLKKLKYEEAALKERIKDAEAEYKACLVQIEDLGYVAKIGTAEYQCKQTETFKIPIGSKLAWYSLVKGVLMLVSVRDMTDSEKNELFNACNNNYSQMLTITTGEVKEGIAV